MLEWTLVVWLLRSPEVGHEIPMISGEGCVQAAENFLSMSPHNPAGPLGVRCDVQVAASPQFFRVMNMDPLPPVIVCAREDGGDEVCGDEPTPAMGISGFTLPVREPWRVCAVAKRGEFETLGNCRGSDDG